MKKLLLGVVAFASAVPAFAGEHYVSGYTRRDGTYVAPHYQTNPNGTLMDNYSTRGNVNPHTGQLGTVDPNAPAAFKPFTVPCTPTAFHRC